MAEAIFGLIGVAMGALLTGGANYWLRRRDERAEVRAVGRMVLQELDLIAQQLSSQYELGRSDVELFDDQSLPDDRWREHTLLLARHLSDVHWTVLNDAYSARTAVTVESHSLRHAESPERTERWLRYDRTMRDARTAVDRARDVLAELTRRG